MNPLNHLCDVVLPLVAASGRVGDKVQFLRCSGEDNVSGEAQFMSSVSFVTAVFEDGSKKQLECHLVVKYNMSDEVANKWLRLDEQFQNEIIVYEKVLPFLFMDTGRCVEDIFPKFLYGFARPGGDSSKYIIVLEDLRQTGYRMSQDTLDLDFNHCALAFKKLGEFHALSFLAKKVNPGAFYKVVDELIDARFFKGKTTESDSLFDLTVGRASKPLLDKGEKVEEIVNFRNKLKDSLGYFENLEKPTEPMAVVCHGDFCRNNILFKYDDLNNIPVDVRFFDLATSFYTSPMVDFSFMFFLNNSEESRRLHREEYLKIYHEAMVTACKGIEVPSLENFREEFRLKAVYGFLICSFFKPSMMDPVRLDLSEAVYDSESERKARVLCRGGDKATGVICNMLREIIDLQCVL